MAPPANAANPPPRGPPVSPPTRPPILAPTIKPAPARLPNLSTPVPSEKDTGWTEEAREAARAARETRVGRGELKSGNQLSQAINKLAETDPSFRLLTPEAQRALAEAEVSRGAIKNIKASLWGPKKESYYDPKTNTLHNVWLNTYPYKVTQFDPNTSRHNVIAEAKTFGRAYGYPAGTHVMQRHGTNAEVQHAANVSPLAEGTVVERLATRAGAGFIAGAPIGAAVGGLAGGPLGLGLER
jgi:hypothetical protein